MIDFAGGGFLDYATARAEFDGRVGQLRLSVNATPHGGGEVIETLYPVLQICCIQCLLLGTNIEHSPPWRVLEE